jgi:hypothetical protein
VKKRALRKRAWQLFRALVDRSVEGSSNRAASFRPLRRAQRARMDRKLRVNVELQDDFSLHQALSLYLLDTLPLLNRGLAGLSVRRAHPVRGDRRGSRRRSCAGRWTG